MKTRRLLTSLLVLLLAVSAGGCRSGQVDATVLLNHGNCHGAREGLTEVSLADVARLRGSTLLGMTTAEPAAEDPAVTPLLIAVSRGPQPTPGYGFELKGVSVSDDIVTIVVDWSTPDPSAVLAQVITSPCLVVGLDRGDYRKVRAVDRDGTVLGELDLGR